MSFEQNNVTIWLLKDFLYCHKLHTLLSAEPKDADKGAIATYAILGPLKFLELLPKHLFNPTLQVVQNKRTENEFGWDQSFRYDGQVDENGNRAGYGRLQVIDYEIMEGHWSDNGTICNGR